MNPAECVRNDVVVVPDDIPAVNDDLGTIACGQDDIIPAVGKGIVERIIRVLVCIVNEAGEEPEGHSRPHVPLGVSVGLAVVGPELAGKGLLEVGLAHVVGEPADLAAIKIERPVTLGGRVDLDGRDPLCREPGGGRVLHTVLVVVVPVIGREGLVHIPLSVDMVIGSEEDPNTVDICGNILAVGPPRKDRIALAGLH